MQKSDLIFLGDSLTQRNNWSVFKASNMGIDGDTTDGVFSRISSVKSAKTIVLMVGVNDILKQTPLPTVQTNYTKILNSFKNDQNIFILSLLPVIDAPQTKTINKNIKTLNRWLRSQTKKKNFNYLDFYPHFLDAKQAGLKDKFTSDGIHLTSHAYRLWSTLLKNELQK